MVRKKQEPKKEPTPKKTCLKCGKTKASVSSNFYKHAENQFKPLDGLHPICSACIDDQIDESNLESVYKVLEHLDRPFLPDRWKSSIEESKNRKANGSQGWGVWKCYMKNISMKEVIHYTWKDSYFINIPEQKTEKETETDKKEETNTKSNNNKNLTVSNVDNFQVTDELIDKYGVGFKPEEYYYFEKKYNRLSRNYTEKTEMHTEGLITYIIYKVKAELATARGDLKEAKDWDALATKAATEAKLNVRQMSKSDISGGIDVMSQLFEAVESELGIIPLLPRLLAQPYDDADMIIWANINYARKLEEKPMVKYKEVYDFYDTMIEEYCVQAGMDEEQIKLFKEKRNNVFRDLGEIYIEPLYEGINGDE